MSLQIKQLKVSIPEIKDHRRKSLLKTPIHITINKSDIGEKNIKSPSVNWESKRKIIISNQ